MTVTFAVIAISLLCSAVASLITRPRDTSITFAEAYHSLVQQDNDTLSHFIARHINSTADQWNHLYIPITIPELQNGKLHVGNPNQSDSEVSDIEKRESCTFTVSGFPNVNECDFESPGIIQWGPIPCDKWDLYQCDNHNYYYARRKPIVPMRAILYRTSDLYINSWSAGTQLAYRTWGYQGPPGDLYHEPRNCNWYKLLETKMTLEAPRCVANGYPADPLFFPRWDFRPIPRRNTWPAFSPPDPKGHNEFYHSGQDEDSAIRNASTVEPVDSSN